MVAAIGLPILLGGVGVVLDYATMRSYRAMLRETFHAAAGQTSSSMSAGVTDALAADSYAKALVMASLEDRLSPLEREELRTRIAVRVVRVPRSGTNSYDVTITGGLTLELPFLSRVAGYSAIAVVASAGERDDLSAR